jgi:protein-disulfide isomerase
MNELDKIANQTIDNDAKRDQHNASSINPRPFRFWTLIGIVALIVISGANVYELDRQRTDLDAQVQRLASAMGVRLVNSRSSAGADGPDQTKIYTVRTEGAPFLGPAAAPIRIVEFSDFQCGYCARVGLTLTQIRDIYKDEVQIIWKNLPITSIHSNAMDAALAAQAAYKQGKFWEFHDKLFANQDKLDADSLRQYAAEVGLNTAQFETDRQSSEAKQRVDEDITQAQSLGVTGTPTFFINGHLLVGTQPLSKFADVINAELSRQNIPIPPAAAGI